TAALDNAAHLTTGAALAGLAYERLGGATGAQALAAGNLVPLVAFLALLPCVVNGTFYIELALGRTLAWVDAALTARWEAVVYACSAGLALGCLGLAHASLDMIGFLVIGAVLVSAAVASLSVIRRGVHADELALIQSLSQAIARDISLAKSFPRIREPARRLVACEHLGFARYDAATNEMERIAGTAATPGGKFRYDANAGLTGEVLRLRRPVVARALARQQVVAPGGGEQPGSEVLVPLYHGAQLVGVWSVRHSDPAMYRDSDGALLALLAPQLALMLAIEGSVQPVVGASDRTSSYIATLTATTQQIHASSEEVAASARRASRGAAEAAGLVSALAGDATALAQHAGEVAAAGDETRASGAQMEQTTEKVRLATQAAVRRLSDLGLTTEE